VGALGAIVDGDALLEMLWTASLAGIGVTAVFAVALLGTTRAADFGRDGRSAQAALFGLLGLLAIAAVAAAVVFGIIVMLRK
jgi:hypothetical protein